MPSRSRFVIQNDQDRPLILNIEPEGHAFALEQGEEVQVLDSYREAPVTLTISRSEQGDPVVSIWPGDGEIRVEHLGVDVLEEVEAIRDPLAS